MGSTWAPYIVTIHFLPAPFFTPTSRHLPSPQTRSFSAAKSRRRPRQRHTRLRKRRWRSVIRTLPLPARLCGSASTCHPHWRALLSAALARRRPRATPARRRPGRRPRTTTVGLATRELGLLRRCPARALFCPARDLFCPLSHRQTRSSLAARSRKRPRQRHTRRHKRRWSGKPRKPRLPVRQGGSASRSRRHWRALSPA